MLRFKQYLNERRARPDFATREPDFGRDSRADFGGGSGAGDFGGGFAGQVKSAPLKTPDNAAVAKAPPQQTIPKPPTPIGPEAEKSQTPDFGFPKPFTKGPTGPAFKKFDEYMKTGKPPNPNLHANPATGGPMEIPGIPGGSHQATVHMKNPATGQMDSISSDAPHHLSIHVHNPHTGSSLSLTPYQQSGGEQQQDYQTPAGPAPTPGKLFSGPGGSKPAPAAPAPAAPKVGPNQDSYEDIIRKSLGNIGIKMPEFGGSPKKNWRDEPGRRQGPAPQAAPQAAPASTPAPQVPTPASQAPTSAPQQSTERPGEPSSLKFGGPKTQELYRKAERFKTDPESELKKMLGPKYVAP